MKNSPISPEVSSDENNKLPLTTTKQDIAAKASEVGAAYMLPPHEMDSPLTAEEITPRFGEPVVMCRAICACPWVISVPATEMFSA